MVLHAVADVLVVLGRVNEEVRVETAAALRVALKVEAYTRPLITST